MALALSMAPVAAAEGGPPVIASGEVRSASDDSVIGGAIIEASWWNALEGGWESAGRAVSAADGSYTLWDTEGRGAGDYKLEVSAYGYRLSEFDAIWDGVNPLAMSYLRLLPALPIAGGVVRDSVTGDPIAGARIVAEEYDQYADSYSCAGSATSAWDGQYLVFDEMVLGTGEYRFVVEAKGYATSTYAEEWYGTTIPLDADLDPLVLIATGVVIDNVMPEPMFAAYVVAELLVGSEWVEAGSDVTGGDGVYTVYDEHGYGASACRVHVYAHPYRNGFFQTDWNGIAPIEHDFIMDLATPIVSGTVTDAATGSALEAYVSLRWWDSASEEWVWVSDTAAKSTGVYTLYDKVGIGAGTYRLDVESYGYRSMDAARYWNGTDLLVIDFELEDSLTPVNDAPVAVDDSYETDEDTSLAVTAPGVLSNDTDSDGDTLTAIKMTDPANGTVTLSADGGFTYTPDTDFVGVDTFTYRASDGTAESDAAIVTITVNDSDESLPPVISIAGPDRFATAVEASKVAFPNGAETVVIATGRNWPDALGGTALAGALDAPILLVEPGSVPAVVAAEIVRLEVSEAVILGGTSAVSADVATELAATLAVTRIGGTDRYETAVRVAERAREVLGDAWDGTAFIATGGNFPDALAAAPLAAAQGWPLYLSNPETGLTGQTKTAMADVTRCILLGGSDVVIPSAEDYVRGIGADVIRLEGPTRYETAVAVAIYAVGGAGHTWDRAGITTGQNFPDALAGGVVQGRLGSVMVLTHPDTLTQASADLLANNKDDITTVVYYGGTNAVSQAVRDAVAQLLE